MSKASAAAAEPSMEEILASIRKIISDDEPAPAKDKEEPTPSQPSEPEISEMEMAMEAQPEPEIDEIEMVMTMEPSPPVQDIVQDEADDDIFELTEDMESDAQEPLSTKQPIALENDDDSDIMFLDAEEQEEAPTPIEPPVQAIKATPIQTEHHKPLPPKEPLLDNLVDAAVASQFSTLSNIILSNNARTLDDIVAEMMRPMLKSWLDSNLPIMVENIVREEIERVSRGNRR